jgi:chloramphenicol-sensitive protein RarD
MHQEQQRGLLYGLGAYGLWGVIPIFFKAISAFANSYDILCHRIVWSAVLLIVVLTLLRRWGELYRALRNPISLLALLLSSVLIGLNWFVYIYSVETHRVMQSSLGYFITPLVNIALGVLFFGERFRRLQGVALCFGLSGMLLMACLAEEFPWIALSLTATFSCYGLCRKLIPAETLVGLAAETFLLTPLSLWYLWDQSSAWHQTDTLGHWMLILSGPATVIPLYCFGQAARLLPLTYLGFLQYLSPSLQFLVAAWLFGEPLSALKLASFALVWVGLLIFSVDVWRARKAGWVRVELINTEEGPESVPEPPVSTAKP